MKKKFKLVLLVLALMLVMVSCKETDPITLPNTNDSQVVTVTKIEEDKEEPTAFITSKENIVGTIKLMQEKAEPTREQSNNDTPTNTEDFRKMEVFYEEDKKMTLYLYQNKKLYIERPYEGVWEIDNDMLNRLVGTM